mmetsp:Transcript_105171/g.292907  ORF Transcript_105171/g.292907 Transcript_105171/m.292907 type:complete len:220 (+) Transcript_105171:1-660(+)
MVPAARPTRSLRSPATMACGLFDESADFLAVKKLWIGGGGGNTSPSASGAGFAELAVAELGSITAAEVEVAQEAWGDAVVQTGALYSQDHDYAAYGAAFVRRLYAYGTQPVLFKPVTAAEKQFRLSFEETVSYFVGRPKLFPQDYGFALRPWTSVRWENADILLHGNTAMAMGTQYFVAGNTTEKLQYSLGYVRDLNGSLRIILHHSSLPEDSDLCCEL